VSCVSVLKGDRSPRFVPIRVRVHDSVLCAPSMIFVRREKKESPVAFFINVSWLKRNFSTCPLTDRMVTRASLTCALVVFGSACVGDGKFSDPTEREFVENLIAINSGKNTESIQRITPSGVT